MAPDSGRYHTITEQHYPTEQQKEHADADRMLIQPNAYDGVTACLQCCGDKQEAQNGDFLHGYGPLNDQAALDTARHSIGRAVL